MSTLTHSLGYQSMISLNSVLLEGYMCLYWGWGWKWNLSLKPNTSRHVYCVSNFGKKLQGNQALWHEKQLLSRRFSPPTGSFHSETRHAVVFFLLAVIFSQPEGGLALEIHSTLIRGNSQPLMEAIKQYRSHIIALDYQDGCTCRSVRSAATPCQRFKRH